MTFLSDRALRSTALALGVSGWFVAWGIASQPSGRIAVPAVSAALAEPVASVPTLPDVQVVSTPARPQAKSASSQAAPVPAAKRRRAAPAAPQRSLPPIADPAPPAAAAPAPPHVLVAAAAPAARPVAPSLALIGVTAVRERDSAWLVDLSTGERRVVSVGDAAFGYEVKTIQADAVTLTQGGRELELRLGANVQSFPSRQPRVEAAPRVPADPPTGSPSVYNPVTVTTYVNVYPPDQVPAEVAGEPSRRNDARYHQPSESVPPVVIFNSNRNRNSNRSQSGRQPYWDTRGYRSVGTRSIRRRSARVTGPSGDAQLLPEPVVNPQTIRRMGATGAHVGGDYPRSFKDAGRRSFRPSDKWQSTPGLRR